MDTRQTSVRAKLSDETFKEVLEKLKEHRKCMMIRPTGFGKTYLLAHLTRKFKRPLYLYPINIIRLDVKDKYKHILNKNTKFLSYRTLLNIFKADKDKIKNIANKYDLIIIDEAHMAGADKTSQAVRELMEVAKDNCFIGATATPDRSDGFDVTKEFFDNNTISEYTLNDAIEDGLIPKPYYVYSLYEDAVTRKQLTTEIEKIVDKAKRESMVEKLKAMEVELGRLTNAPNIIKETIDKVHPEVKYMKFIVFFSEKKTLEIKHNDVIKWFRQAYPTMDIRKLIITSDGEYVINTSKLGNLWNRENTIDLIFCIDMLNMGYHIDDITGVIMLRGTSSNTVYKQQVGRCLSAASDKTPIMLDLVNNILRDPYFGKFDRAENINDDEFESRGSRINSIETRNLIINDIVAKYSKFIKRMLHDTRETRIEEAVWYYVNKSATLEFIASKTKLDEEYIREEFRKRGIDLED